MTFTNVKYLIRFIFTHHRSCKSKLNIRTVIPLSPSPKPTNSTLANMDCGQQEKGSSAWTEDAKVWESLKLSSHFVSHYATHIWNN